MSFKQARASSPRTYWPSLRLLFPPTYTQPALLVGSCVTYLETEKEKYKYNSTYGRYEAVDMSPNFGINSRTLLEDVHVGGAKTSCKDE